MIDFGADVFKLTSSWYLSSLLWGCLGSRAVESPEDATGFLLRQGSGEMLQKADRGWRIAKGLRLASTSQGRRPLNLSPDRPLYAPYSHRSPILDSQVSMGGRAGLGTTPCRLVQADILPLTPMPPSGPSRGTIVTSWRLSGAVGTSWGSPTLPASSITCPVSSRSAGSGSKASGRKWSRSYRPRHAVDQPAVCPHLGRPRYGQG